MEEIKGPICYAEVGKRNFKETHISPYNNKEYECYKCPNCNVHWWELLKIVPESYVDNGAL
jgi:hypothetical protein